MNSYSHIRIGRMILPILQSKYHVSLPTTVFLWANCRPDYSFKYKRVPHYKGPMEKIFAQLFVETSYYRWEKHEPFLIADRLGVICHFLCDFFCYAHSPFFSGGITEHICYEAKVNRFLKEYQNVCQKWVHSNPSFSNQSTKDVLHHLEKQYQHYLSRQTSVACDIQYSLEACMELTSYLLARILYSEIAPINCKIHNVVSV